MRYAIFLALLLAQTKAFATLDFEIKNVTGWKVAEISDRDPVKKLSGGAEATIVREDAATDLTINIFVHTLKSSNDVKPTGTDLVHWRKALFGDRLPKGQRESIIRKDGVDRYIVEFQSDSGTATMLHSLVMVTTINGKLYAFSYENERGDYLKQAEEIKELLRALVLSPKPMRPSEPKT
ncbi:MAG: hypothetical protein KF799_07830 [Bdellovibrionales bacterium]|nr:hypothetical protein [Bdellovibrionales bacterium]